MIPTLYSDIGQNAFESVLDAGIARQGAAERADVRVCSAPCRETDFTKQLLALLALARLHRELQTDRTEEVLQT